MHILPITILLFFFTPYLSISFAEIGVFTDAETGFHVELLEERKRSTLIVSVKFGSTLIP